MSREGGKAMIACVRWLLVVLFVVVTFPFLCLVLLLNPRKQDNLYLACKVYRAINWIFGVRVEVGGFDAIAPDRSYIYVANHQSNHDAAGRAAVQDRCISHRQGNGHRHHPRDHQPGSAPDPPQRPGLH
uniref:1-acylglycerol-3-phosphate O-acyltransferase n=1 Tax=Steinernema glaseri TaxID=37863 RepID=A0A1I7YU15_9BILA